MPRTTAQQERSLQDPAVCELLKIRDFLDNVMIRTDGCHVAGCRLQGAVSYFADDDGRNEAKGVVESLLRAMPEQSMRVQFRYEVVERLNGLLDRYRDASRSETPEVKVLDDRRLATWEEKERLALNNRRLQVWTGASYCAAHGQRQFRLITAGCRPIGGTSGLGSTFRVSGLRARARSPSQSIAQDRSIRASWVSSRRRFAPFLKD